MYTSQPTQRRSKYSKLSRHSCATCRKHKTRCEILEHAPADGILKCHRCIAVKIHCSYSDVDRHLVPPPEQPSVCMQQPQQTSFSQQASASSNSSGTSTKSLESDIPFISQIRPLGVEESVPYPALDSLPLEAEAKPDIPKLWKFLDPPMSLNWRAPVACLHEITKVPYSPSSSDSSSVSAASSIDDILSHQERQYLLDL
jgi:hypothetical protein